MCAQKWSVSQVNHLILCVNTHWHDSDLTLRVIAHWRHSDSFAKCLNLKILIDIILVDIWLDSTCKHSLTWLCPDSSCKNSLTCLWLICDMPLRANTHWHDSHLTLRVNTYWHNSEFYVTWPIDRTLRVNTSAPAKSCAEITLVSEKNRICDMTRSYGTWLVDMWHDSFICDMARSYVTWLVHMWHGSFICDMTHS